MQKLSPLTRRVEYLKKGIDMVIDSLFKQALENEAGHCELNERVKKLRKNWRECVKNSQH